MIGLSQSFSQDHCLSGHWLGYQSLRYIGQGLEVESGPHSGLLDIAAAGTQSQQGGGNAFPFFYRLLLSVTYCSGYRDARMNKNQFLRALGEMQAHKQIIVTLY